MKKWILGVIVALLVVASALFFYVSGLEIGADVATDEATKTAIESNPQESSLIFLDDSKAEVKPSETVAYNIKVDFRSLVADNLGVSSETDLSEDSIKSEAAKIFDTSSGDFFIQTSLLNQAATTEIDTPFYSSDHRININNLINKNLSSFEITIPATIPASSQSNNLMVSKVYLLKRVSSCSASDTRIQRIKCAYAKAFQGANDCVNTCTYAWEKIAEATDTDLIDASANNVDLEVVSIITPDTTFGYWKTLPTVDREIAGVIKNSGSDYAANVKVILKAPKGTISKTIPTDTTYSEEGFGNEKYDVLTWNFNSLDANKGREIKAKFNPENIAACLNKYNVTMTVSSISTDINDSNNKKTIQFRSKGCDWIFQATGIKK